MNCKEHKASEGGCSRCHHNYIAGWEHGGGVADGDFYTDCGYPREGKTQGLSGDFYIDASEDCIICLTNNTHSIDKEKDSVLWNNLLEIVKKCTLIVETDDRYKEALANQLKDINRSE